MATSIRPLGSRNQFLAQAFAQNGIQVELNADVIRFAERVERVAYTKTYLVGQVNDSLSVQLDVFIALFPGKIVRISASGAGSSEEQALLDAERVFLATEFKLLLTALFSEPNQTQPNVEQWVINDLVRDVHIGPVSAKGEFDAFAQVGWFEELKRGLCSLPLAEGVHWVHFYFFGGMLPEQRVCAVAIDNIQNAELKSVMNQLPWPQLEGPASIGITLVVKGGIECGAILALFYANSHLDHDQLRQKLYSLCHHREADRLLELTPIAAARVFLERSIQLPERAIALELTARDSTSFKLTDDWIFKEMFELLKRDPSITSAGDGPPRPSDSFMALASRSSELLEVNELLRGGAEPYSIRPNPIVITCGREAFQHICTFPSSRQLDDEEVAFVVS